MSDIDYSGPLRSPRCADAWKLSGKFCAIVYDCGPELRLSRACSVRDVFRRTTTALTAESHMRHRGRRVLGGIALDRAGAGWTAQRHSIPVAVD
jgi:hypothetical protein